MESIRIGGSIIYGREQDKRRILELLLADILNNHNGSLVCLVADNGTGKTTMLHTIFKDQRVCGTFDMRLSICMPKRFDQKWLMRLILESVTCAYCDINDLEMLEELVKEELMEKNFLFVLDDFDTKDQTCWDILSMILSISAKGSRVLVSTTRQIVASITGLMQYYYMNHLSNHWCWTIFLRRVSGDDAHGGLGPDLLNIGKDLIDKCKNHTLCVKMISALLRFHLTEEWWRDVLGNGFWAMNENPGGILPGLRICYELLPLQLKKCFKYCSLFPKNYLFSKSQLVLVWLSQGFIVPRQGIELEVIGLEYFNELLSRSFFQHSPFHETEEEFIMPGSIHDLAQYVSINECFMSESYVQKAPEKACHLSVVSCEDHQVVSLKNLTLETQNLQTFMVVSRKALQHESITSPVMNLVDSEDLFVKFGSLRTLDLSNTDIQELPNTIGLLKDLRYLGLDGTKIKCIPSEISNSVHLQTLKAKDCQYLEELPPTIQELSNLWYLDVSKQSGFTVMPCGIGKLTNLRSLPVFNVGNRQSNCEIKELKNLNCLKGSLEICGLENVRNGFNAKESHLTSKLFLKTLSLRWTDIIMFGEGDEEVEISQQVIQNLQPHRNLREFIVRNYPGNSFPTWIEDSAFPNLFSIILDNCYNLEDLTDLGKLPLLKNLSIQKLYAIKTIYLFNGFPSLETLNIWEMYELEEWVEIQDGDFPCLHTPSINRCPFLRNIPCFRSLVELSIYNCTQFPEIIDLPSLEFLKIEGLSRTNSIMLPKSLPGLRMLKISQCPELSSVEGLSDSTCVHEIKISGCPKLEIKNPRVNHLNEKDDPSVPGEEINLNEEIQIHVPKYGRELTRVTNLRAIGFLDVSGARLPAPLKKVHANDVTGSDKPFNLGSHSTSLQTIRRNLPDHRKKRTNVKSNQRMAVTKSTMKLHQSQLDDGYSWRKYGQTDAQGTSYPRMAMTTSIIEFHQSQQDDGYRWRKYGQKDVPGTSHPSIKSGLRLLLDDVCPIDPQKDSNDT